MIFVILVGNTGTGKSTFLSKLNKRENRKIIINDDFYGKDYSHFSSEIFRALGENKNILLEGNYMTGRIRRSVIDTIKEYYPELIFICFDFGPGDQKSLNRRLLNPKTTREDTISIHKKYNEAYEEPQKSEGFSKVIKCN